MDDQYSVSSEYTYRADRTGPPWIVLTRECFCYLLVLLQEKSRLDVNILNGSSWHLRMYRSSTGVMWMSCAAIDCEPHILTALTTFTLHTFSFKHRANAHTINSFPGIAWAVRQPSAPDSQRRNMASLWIMCSPTTSRPCMGVQDTRYIAAALVWSLTLARFEQIRCRNIGCLRVTGAWEVSGKSGMDIMGLMAHMAHQARVRLPEH